MSRANREVWSNGLAKRASDVRRFSPILFTVLWLTTGMTAMGQEQFSDPSLDNFKHPPNTATAPLGELGRVDKVGTGPIPMILIPGAAFGGSIWNDFMERNRTAYTMYAITPAGYEGTPPPPWPENNDFNQRAWTDALCNAVVQLIDDEKLDRPIIVGHHMLGDHYALRIGLDHPDKIRGVVVIAGVPSMAFPAFGENQPGQPIKTASLEQRKQIVESYMAPFYKVVTEKMWKAGSFKGRTFCRDAERGDQLFEQQVSVPIPTQIRYFLEFQTTDLEPELAKLSVPLLVVLPKQEWTLDVFLARNREANEMMYGDEEKSRVAVSKRLEQAWGSVEEGLKWMNDLGFRWDRLRDTVPNLTIHYVDNTETFIMEDQPQSLDDALRSFVGR